MRNVLRGMLVLALILCCACASAEGFGTASTQLDKYNAGMEAYNGKEYAEAAAYFQSAGNLNDAKKWAYYCQAIDSVVNGKGTTKELKHAQARFELLAGQSFQQADQWVTYCMGRAYELEGFTDVAAERYYGKVLVQDSLERYMNCVGKPDLLETEESVRSRTEPHILILPKNLLYEEAMLDYMEDKPESYRRAADYFCLAGNYEDALQWRCYCLAISLIVGDDNVSDAAVLFGLLGDLGFEEAEPWIAYCTGRSYEAEGLGSKAVNYYKTIFIHDSSERYLRLKGVE